MQYFDMIHTPHDHSNVSITCELGIINSQFLRHYSSKVFLISQMVNLIVFLKNTL
jgi:hypothetical protein